MTSQSKVASKAGSNEHKESSDGSAVKDWHRGFDYTDPRLNTKYGDPSKLSLSPTNSTPRVSYEQDPPIRWIMRWQLHCPHKAGKVEPRSQVLLQSTDEARFCCAPRTHRSWGSSRLLKHTVTRASIWLVRWRGINRSSRRSSRRKSVSIRSMERTRVSSKKSERMFVYDLGGNGIAQGPAATHASSMHGRLRGSSVVVTMVEAAIIHFQVSTMEKCFFACDWVERRNGNAKL